MRPDRLDPATTDGCEQNLDELRRLIPGCITETQDPKTGEMHRTIDVDELLRATGLKAAVDETGERYLFTWPGKQAARRRAAEPIDKTLRPCPGESIGWDTTRNLYIEGDNLEVLKLLEKSYSGKVKVIYIDPPYNTGNDFVYHDDFARTAREEAVASGDLDSEGNRYRVNRDSEGRFHSDWCSMIYPRLLLARKLLSEEGVIFISIDDNEVHNLRKICDEVFGASNFVAQLVWERAFAPKNDAKYVSNSHDYVVMYARQIDTFQIGRLPRTDEANARYSNPDNDPRGVWQSDNLSVKTYTPENDYPITTPSGRIVEPPAGRCWSLSKKAFFERLHDNRIWFGADGNGVPRIKRFLSELRHKGMVPTSILFHKEVGHSQEATQSLNKLMDGGYFDGPKPLGLLRRLLTMGNLETDSIVLDFFSGSGTTAHAVMELNAEDGGHRRFICVQLPEETPEKSEAHKAGYKTIPEIARERIRRAGAKIRAEHPDLPDEFDSGFRLFRCDSGNYREAELPSGEYSQEMLKGLVDNIKEDRSDEDLLIGAMLSLGLKLSLPIEVQEVEGQTIYRVDGNRLVACFAKEVTEKVVKEMAKERPEGLLFRDSCFEDDSAKINIYELLKQELGWDEAEALLRIRVL